MVITHHKSLMEFTAWRGQISAGLVIGNLLHEFILDDTKAWRFSAGGWEPGVPNAIP